MADHYTLPDDVTWTEVAPGNRCVVLSHRPEAMLVAFRFEPGAIGAALPASAHTGKLRRRGRLTSPSTASPQGWMPARASSSPPTSSTASWLSRRAC